MYPNITGKPVGACEYMKGVLDNTGWAPGAVATNGPNGQYMLGKGIVCPVARGFMC